MCVCVCVYGMDFEGGFDSALQSNSNGVLQYRAEEPQNRMKKKAKKSEERKEEWKKKRRVEEGRKSGRRKEE